MFQTGWTFNHQLENIINVWIRLFFFMISRQSLPGTLLSSWRIQPTKDLYLSASNKMEENDVFLFSENSEQKSAGS